MEDNLKNKMEDDLQKIFEKMEDDLKKNGRRPTQIRKWKTSSSTIKKINLNWL